MIQSKPITISQVRNACARIFLLAVLWQIAPSLHAQNWLYPETIAEYNPLRSNDRSDSLRLLPDVAFWGQVGMFAIARDRDHRWDVTLGGTVDLIGTHRWDLVFETNLHLLVDPNNNIAFNPRAFAWTEGLLVGFRRGAQLWQFGYQHRCKHDVDNLELLYTEGREESRTLIYGSIMARWQRIQSRFDAWRFDPLAEIHFYITRQDQRFPYETRELLPSLERIFFAARARITSRIAVSNTISIGATLDARATAYNRNSTARFSIGHVALDPTAELFAEFDGVAGKLYVFSRASHMPDDFVPPVPKRARLIEFGIRIVQSND